MTDQVIYKINNSSGETYRELIREPVTAEGKFEWLLYILREIGFKETL